MTKSRFSQRICEAVTTQVARYRSKSKDDSGQALVLALIIVVMIGLLPAITYTVLQSTSQETSSSVDYEAALAAAQAGLQSYRNLLDEYQGYDAFNGQSQPPANDGGCNPAFTNGTSSCPTQWVSVATSTSPSESYEYTPDTTQLRQTASSGSGTPPTFPGEILLTVIGKAGSGNATAYRRIEAALRLSGAPTDLYFSKYEQPSAGDYDQWDNEYSGGTHITQMPYAYDEATETVGTFSGASSSAPADPETGVPYASALCQYDADQANQFIDWYSQYVSPIYPPNSHYPGYPNVAYNTGSNLGSTAANQYYGPWYGVWNDPGTPSGQTYTFGSSTAGDVGAACQTNFWITGNTFNGPVYSQDELTTCGSPSFTSLSTAVPANFPFPAGWPGAKPSSGGVSNPYGYDHDPFNNCGSGSYPTFPAGVSPTFGISQALPSLADQIASDIKTGAQAGCIYSGPTAIRFYWNPSTQSEYMDVWSPLTKDTYTSQGPASSGLPAVQCGAIATTGAQDLCGGTSCTYSGNVPTNTQVQPNASNQMTVQTSPSDFAQVPVYTGEAIWVQGSPTPGVVGQSPSCTVASVSDPNNCWTTLPAAETNAPQTGCIDPWTEPDQLVDTQTCSEADLMVGGATHGGIMLGSGDNIELARSLVYSCALSSSSTTQPGYSTGISGCSSSADVTGLVADNQIWMSDTNATTTCADDYDMALSNVAWSDMLPVGTLSTNNCYIGTPIIDGAVTALQGFFDVENFGQVADGGNQPDMYLNGNVAVTSAGQYGQFGSIRTGYLLQLNFDTRLQYDLPPDYLSATGAVWEVMKWVSCGTSSSNASSCAPLAS